MSYIIEFSWIFYLFIFLLGLILGSFLNSWTWRTRENIKIVASRSMCPQCRRKLAWYENIPALSFFFLGGRCRTCKQNIPRHYLWVELGTPIIFTLVAWHHLGEINFNYVNFFRDIFFSSLLIIIFIFDWLYEVVLTSVVWLGLVGGFFFNFFYLGYDLKSLLVGSAVGGGFFLSQFVVSKGKWIGGGDIRLGLMMGMWLGWPMVLVALAIAYIAGTVISLGLILAKKKEFASTTPFGTYLTFGTLVAILWGASIVGWYLNFLR